MSENESVPKDAFERLKQMAERLQDAVAFDQAVQALAEDEDESLPAGFAYRLIAGEAPLLVYRDLRGLTRAQLAEASELTLIEIVDIEAGRVACDREILHKLAQVLDTTADDLAV